MTFGHRQSSERWQHARGQVSFVRVILVEDPACALVTPSESDFWGAVSNTGGKLVILSRADLVRACGTGHATLVRGNLDDAHA